MLAKNFLALMTLVRENHVPDLKMLFALLSHVKNAQLIFTIALAMK